MLRLVQLVLVGAFGGFYFGMEAQAQTAPIPCQNPVVSRVVTLTGAVYCNGTTPADGGLSVPLRGRKSLMVCNSEETPGTNTLKVLISSLDGGASPAWGATSPGDVLAKGKCERYGIGPSVTAKCLGDAGTVVEMTECQ